MPLDNEPPAMTEPAVALEAGARRRRSAGYGLDALNLVVANVQTGFGPFVAVFLTSQGWTQTSIGVALSIGTVTAMASQVPAGALVDIIRRKSLVALVSVAAFAASAMMLALSPIPLSVYLAEILHGFSSCTLGPATAALSLGIAGTAAMGARLGRNARFASIGNGVGAALMGACGYYLSEQSVFFLTAALTLPAIAAVLPLYRFETAGDMATLADPATKAECEPQARQAAPRLPIRRLLADRRLIIFALCAALFTLGNAALLPLVSSTVTKDATGEANLLIAACIILPQVLVALLSPTVGKLADRRGRRFVILTAFAALGLRALLFACISRPEAVVAIQALDGIAGACFGVMVPLVTSDIAGRSGHFNLSLGVIGFAIGIGATISTSLAGWTADHFGEVAAFLAMAVVAAVGAVVAATVLPETRPTNNA